jgi:hypothetical protein
MPATEFTPRVAAGMDARSAQDSRNPGIELLRRSSILFVILNHLGLRIPLKKTALAEVLPGRSLHRLNYNGYEAVPISRQQLPFWPALVSADVPLCWVLGRVVEGWLSTPFDRWLRLDLLGGLRRLLP